MTLSNADIELLEAYWAGELPAQQAAVLTERLDNDQVFRRAVVEWQKLVAVLQPDTATLSRRQDLKAMLGAFSQARSKARSRKRWLWGVGVVLLLSLVAWISIRGFLITWISIQGFIAPLQQPIPEKLNCFSTPFFQHFDRLDNTLSTPALNGLQLYDRKRYAEAIVPLQEMFRSSGDSTRLFYAALAAVGSCNPDIAIPVLERFQYTAQWEDLREPAHWYLALAYGSAGRLDEMSTQLRSLANRKGSYADQAAVILRELKLK